MLFKYHRTSTAKLYLDRSVADHSVNESSNVRLQVLGSVYAAGDTGVGPLMHRNTVLYFKINECDGK